MTSFKHWGEDSRGKYASQGRARQIKLLFSCAKANTSFHVSHYNDKVGNVVASPKQLFTALLTRRGGGKENSRLWSVLT